jgi:hypothetical protein
MDLFTAWNLVPMERCMLVEVVRGVGVISTLALL